MTLRDFSQSLPMLLLRSHQAVMAQFRPVLRRHRITEQQWRVLRALGSVDDARITRLAEMTLISKPSLSRLLPALEARRLVRRSAAADDLRGASIRIAPAGLALIDAVSPHSEARYRAIGECIGDEAMAALYALLPRLAEQLESSQHAQVSAVAVATATASGRRTAKALVKAIGEVTVNRAVKAVASPRAPAVQRSARGAAAPRAPVRQRDRPG